jgi:hypothetical protein
MTFSPEQQLINLTQITGHVDETAIADVFDHLKPVSPDFILGEWSGGSFDTGHPIHRTLRAKKWAGKSFRSTEDVDPMVLYDDAGKRYRSEDYGRARVSRVHVR